MTRLLVAAWPAFAVVAGRRGQIDLVARATALAAFVAVTVALLLTWSSGEFIG